MAGRPPFQLKQKPRRDETNGQKHVVKMLRAYLPDQVWWTVSLSGIRLPMEVAVEAKRMGMQKGAPDFSFVFPDKTGLTRYIDLKTPTGSLTFEQRMLMRRVGKDNFKVCIVHPHVPGRTWAEFKATIDPWLAGAGLAWLTDTESVQREARRRAAA